MTNNFVFWSDVAFALWTHSFDFTYIRPTNLKYLVTVCLKRHTLAANKQTNNQYLAKGYVGVLDIAEWDWRGASADAAYSGFRKRDCDEDCSMSVRRGRKWAEYNYDWGPLAAACEPKVGAVDSECMEPWPLCKFVNFVETEIDSV